MHTNYDVCRMADVAAKRLGLRKGNVMWNSGEDEGSLFGDEFSFSYRVMMPTCEENGVVQGIGRVGEFPRQMTLAECAETVKKSYGVKGVRFYGDPEAPVRRVAVSPGSGKNMAAYALAAGADVLVTGDIGHHDGIDAVAQGLCIIDAGHYGIERVFRTDLRELLNQHLPELTVEMASQKEPFTVL
jgi:putative NIF3 family GTP cyclohydrolase 1 type 2